MKCRELLRWVSAWTWGSGHAFEVRPGVGLAAVSCADCGVTVTVRGKVLGPLHCWPADGAAAPRRFRRARDVFCFPSWPSPAVLRRTVVGVLPSCGSAALIEVMNA